METSYTISKRNVLKNDLFESLDKNIIFTQDNIYYNFIREHINSFLTETLSNLKNKLILEIGPKENDEERIKSLDNCIETCDIIENNTTYIADLTKNNNIPNEKYDVIYCLEVLEHTQEPWNMIEQLYLKLKKNGVLHLSVPLNFRLHGPIPDGFRITEYGLKYLLEKNYFKIVHFECIYDENRPAFPIHYNISCIKLEHL